MAFYHEDIVEINLNGGSLHRSFKSVSIGTGDKNANRFGMRVYRDGEPVELTDVNCQAVFQDPRGNNIALTNHGTVYGNTAYVTLPQACYNYEGRFCLAIKLIGGGVTGTMRIIDGVINNTHSGSTVAPTGAVPTYQEILSLYSDMEEATAAASSYAAVQNMRLEAAYPQARPVVGEMSLYIGGGVNRINGENSSGSKLARLSVAQKLDAPLMMWMDSDEYEYTIWCYSGTSTATATESMTDELYTTEKTVITNRGNNNYFKIGFRRLDLSDMTSGADDPTKDEYKILHALKLCYMTDTELIKKGIPADGKAVGDEIARRVSDIGEADGITFIEWTKGYYIVTNGNTVDVTDMQVSSQGYWCAVVNCAEGDIFTINGTGGSQARLWCFIDSSGNYLTRSPADTTLENGEITAPENAAKLVLNGEGGIIAVKGRTPDNRIKELKDISDYNEERISILFDWNRFDWEDIADTSRPTGWRTGYIDNNGSGQTSTNYIRSKLIPSSILEDVYALMITPPEGYFVWATVFINDYVGSANFVAQYGDYTAEEKDNVIFLPLKAGQSLVLSVGKFNSDAGDYLTEAFVKTIKCDMLKKCSGQAWESQYNGKKLSLLGDSISAFAADIPTGNKEYYTGSNAGVSSRLEMWYNVLCADLGMTPLVINGWSGSCVTSGVRNDTTYKPASDPDRCEALHSGTTDPDVVLIAMGVNDYSYMDNADKFGTWDGSAALGEESDMSDYETGDFRSAYATMLARIRRKYPDAQIFCITPWFVTRKTTDTGVTFLNAIGKKENDYGKAIREIADIMNVKVIEGTDIGFNRYNFYPTYAEDSSIIPTHPNATGQIYMGHAIAKAMMGIYTKEVTA